MLLLEQRENCFERDCWQPGHITGSAWVMHPDKQRALLTHHKKLNIWVQLGGHCDGESDVRKSAKREACEESGVAVEFLNNDIFDLDIHEIPARKNDPAHLHYDVRYCFVAASEEFQVSDESHALAWVDIGQLEGYTNEISMLRMRDKWRNLKP